MALYEHIYVSLKKDKSLVVFETFGNCLTLFTLKPGNKTAKAETYPIQGTILFFANKPVNRKL